MRAYVIAACLALLAGCASAPPTPTSRPAPAASVPPPASTPPPIAKPAPSTPLPDRAESPTPTPTPLAADGDPRTRGGFYRDDGPPPTPPANIDAIAEPEPKPEPLHRYANNPYVVFGVRYVPERELRAATTRGVASWYGRRFHGNPTSTGEIYDMFRLSAAHPTLPLPSYARVTNVANGRSVVVRVNDRGPFLRGRSIDLSYAAAARLGYIEQGSAQVEIESLDPRDTALAREREAGPAGVVPAPTTVVAAGPSLTAAPTAPMTAAAAPVLAPVPASPLPIVEEAQGVFIQLGAYKSAGNAENVLARFIFQLEDFASRLQIVVRTGLHRIWAGPYRSRAEALAAASRFGTLQQ